jgi:hypothetical protein
MQPHPPYILYLTLASVAAVYSLLGYWLAFGKQSWLWRTGAVCAALVLLVPIRAYEPLVFFALTALFFVGAAGCQSLFLSWWQKRRKVAPETSSAVVPFARPRFQFRLHDLLGLTAVIGVATWMSGIILREQVLMPWMGTLLSVEVAVAITIATIGVLRGPRRVVSGAILLAVVGVSVGYFGWLHRLGGPGFRYVIGGDLGDQLFWSGASSTHALQLFVPLVIFMVFLATFYGAARALQSKDSEPRKRWLWQVLGVTPYLAWLSPTTWLYLQLLSYPQAPAQIRDRPNSLPLILERGQPLESLAGPQARALATELIKLSKELGFVRIPWDADYFGRRNYEMYWLVEVQTARSISRGLDAQATTLETTDPDLAAEHLMAIIRLGNMEQQEGLLIQGLVGMAVEEVGVEHLVRLKRRISSQKGREISAELEEMEKSRDHDHIARDQMWYSLNDRWAFRLDQILSAGTERSSESVYFHYGVTCNRSSCLERLLMLDLALRAYHADHGAYPPKLGLLTPQYLAEVPLDPFSEKPFVYRPARQDFVLYSVGGDGVDNGGNFDKKQHQVTQWEGYDMDLDTPRW